MLTPNPAAGTSVAEATRVARTEHGGRSVANTIKEARDAAIRSLARDLTIDLDEAARWCAAWEQFARRQGGARSRYFWDAGRGWIDAQRAMGMVLAPADSPPARAGSRSSASIAEVRRVDQAS